jgi:GH25 family lysozyme M1 (1,4-beta-N-acetylmuramidase)
VTETLDWETLTAAWAKGEDVSAYQAPVTDWNPNDFGIVKATENCAPHAYVSPSFNTSWASAKKQGKPRGAYHFFHPWSSPHDQAEFFVATVKAEGLERGDFLVADIEITAGLGDWGVPVPLTHSHLLDAEPGYRIKHLTGQDIGSPANVASVNNAARVFLDRVDALVHGLGVTVWVYTNLSVGAELTLCTMYPLWTAYPGTTPPGNVSPWHAWHMWQYGFGGGPHGGDRDEYHGTLDEMKTYLGIIKPPNPPTPVPENWEELMFAKIPAPVCKLGDNDSHTGHRWVHRVQGLLCAVREPVTINGVYDLTTAAAVAAVQQRAGIHVNGHAVSPDTYAVLVTGQPILPPTPVPPAADEPVADAPAAE